jgi:hypothetical protein
MIKYIITHCKHEGCYDFPCFEDNSSRMRVTSIKINPPKIFLFEKKLQAMEFFNDYINDVDCIDIRCRKGNEVEHIDHCTCGIIELDDEDNPILFYNKTNQIFFLEIGAQTFMTSQDLQIDILNMNLTNKLIRKCRRLDKEQQKKYVELGEVCKECLEEDDAQNHLDKVSDNEE